MRKFWVASVLILSVLTSALFAICVAIQNSGENSGRNILYRQQQAVLKSALDNYLSARLIHGQLSLEQVGADYNATSGNRARLALVAEFYEHLLEYSTEDQIQSKAMLEQNPPKHIQFADWPAPSSQNRNTYPSVNMLDGPAPLLLYLSGSEATRLIGIVWLVAILAAILLFSRTKAEPAGSC